MFTAACAPTPEQQPSGTSRLGPGRDVRDQGLPQRHENSADGLTKPGRSDRSPTPTCLVRIRHPGVRQLLETLPTYAPALGAQVDAIDREHVERRVAAGSSAALRRALAGLVTRRCWRASKLRRPSAPRISNSPFILSRALGAAGLLAVCGVAMSTTAWLTWARAGRHCGHGQCH
jgi:hypothetical protein